MVAERHLGVIINKQAEFRRTEKVGEGMALKIWAELRQPFRFILAFGLGHFAEEELPEVFFGHAQ